MPTPLPAGRQAPSDPEPQRGGTVHARCGSADRRGGLNKDGSNSIKEPPPTRIGRCFKQWTEGFFLRKIVAALFLRGMNKTQKALYVGVITIFACFLSSCATPPSKLQLTPVPQAVVPVIRQDIFHVVAPGETLWRISMMYNVPSQEISRANNLYSKDPVLEKGQRLLIPNAAPVMPVISLYPSKKWKYIIIHHSATDEGSSLFFDKAHLSRGWDGVGYHFVIDNGTKGKDDGQIEVSPRWLKQANGSHCKASGMNTKAIGVCLVGNFSKEKPTLKQMDALVYLVNKLRKYYRIPLSRIMGHGQVPGAKTECPGKNFPWRGFKSRLTAG